MCSTDVHFAFSCVSSKFLSDVPSAPCEAHYHTSFANNGGALVVAQNDSAAKWPQRLFVDTQANTNIDGRAVNRAAYAFERS